MDVYVGHGLRDKMEEVKSDMEKVGGRHDQPWSSHPDKLTVYHNLMKILLNWKHNLCKKIHNLSKNVLIQAKKIF